jgi:hypothetical protein
VVVVAVAVDQPEVVAPADVVDQVVVAAPAADKPKSRSGNGAAFLLN